MRMKLCHFLIVISVFNINFLFSCLNSCSNIFGLLQDLSVYLTEWQEQNLHPRRRERRGEEGALDKGGAERVGCKGKEAPSPVHHPSPAKKALTCKGGGEDGGSG